MTVTPAVARVRWRAARSVRVASSAYTRVAPETSGMNCSKAATSKPGEVSWSQTSSSVKGWRARQPRRVLATARCGTATPRGRPVLPEV